MSYVTIELGTQNLPITTVIVFRFIISQEEPVPAEGYLVTQIASLGDLGNLYVEYKITTSSSP